MNSQCWLSSCTSTTLAIVLKLRHRSLPVLANNNRPLDFVIQEALHGCTNCTLRKRWSSLERKGNSFAWYVDPAKSSVELVQLTCKQQLWKLTPEPPRDRIYCGSARVPLQYFIFNALLRCRMVLAGSGIFYEPMHLFFDLKFEESARIWLFLWILIQYVRCKLIIKLQLGVILIYTW